MSSRIPGIPANADEEIHAELEKALIDEYLERKGHTMEGLNKLTSDVNNGHETSHAATRPA